MKYFYPNSFFNDDIFINTKLKSLKVGENIFSFEDMEKIKDSYKNDNRIYKPFALLLYTDIINGKGKNYPKLVKLGN